MLLPNSTHDVDWIVAVHSPFERVVFDCFVVVTKDAGKIPVRLLIATMLIADKDLGLCENGNPTKERAARIK